LKIYKFHKININLLQSLRKETNWYSKLHLLNDPFECYLVDNTNTDIYQHFTSSLCACCFSKNMNEILMWSHYADNHRGVCLEFEITNEEIIKGQLIEINYSNELTIIDNVERTSTGHLSLSIISNGKFLATKFKNWSHEEELRTYVICEDANLTGEEKPFLGKLTAIYFGKNAFKDDIALVKHNSSHIGLLKFYLVELNNSNMKIEILREI
jgi:hypothetical protein